MQELTINSLYMRRLLEKMRAIMSRDGAALPDLNVPSTDDSGEETLHEMHGDLLVREFREEIEAMDDDHKHELVALMWVGRGDFDESEWEEAKLLAEERDDGPTWRYLLSHPLAADEIASGLEELGHDHVLLDGDY